MFYFPKTLASALVIAPLVFTQSSLAMDPIDTQSDSSASKKVGKSITDLPDEVLVEIFNWATISHPRETSTRYDGQEIEEQSIPTSTPSNLRNIALTSRHFARNADNHLKQAVLMYAPAHLMTEELSRERVDAIIRRGDCDKESADALSANAQDLISELPLEEVLKNSNFWQENPSQS